MSEPCPNAKKKQVRNAGKIIGTNYWCETQCVQCHGTARVTDCPDCDGCGLKKGGVRCDTCQCYGKVPASTVAA